MAVPSCREIHAERNPKTLTSYLFAFRKTRKSIAALPYSEYPEPDRSECLAFWDIRIAAITERLKMFLPQTAKAETPVPNALLQCALFRVADKRRPRIERLVANFPIQGGGHFQYTGPELRQDDLSVLLGLLEHARLREFSTQIRFIPAHLMRRIGWSDGRESYTRLDASIKRMQVGLFEYVSTSGEGFRVQLLGKVKFSNRAATGEWIVGIDPEIRTIFDAGYSKLRLEERAALPEGLTTWIAGFYASYVFVKPMPLLDLREHSGSGAKTGEFRRMLVAAMGRLREADLIQDYEIRNGRLYVQKRSRSKKPISG